MEEKQLALSEEFENISLIPSFSAFSAENIDAARSSLALSRSVTTTKDGLIFPCSAMSIATSPIGPQPARIATFPPSFIPVIWL